MSIILNKSMSHHKTQDKKIVHNSIQSASDKIFIKHNAYNYLTVYKESVIQFPTSTLNCSFNTNKYTA